MLLPPRLEETALNRNGAGGSAHNKNAKDVERSEAFLWLLLFQQIHIFLPLSLRDFQRRHSLLDGEIHCFHEALDGG